jgi:hypothetical protein
MLHHHQPESSSQKEYVAPPPTPRQPEAEEVEIPVELMNTMRVMLRSGDAKVRQEATEKLLKRGRQGMEIIIRIIEEDKIARKAKTKKAVFVYVGFILLFVLITILVPKSNLMSFMGSFTFILTGAMAATVAQKQSALALAQIEDKQAVPYLLEALSYGDKQVYNAAQMALIKLLPQLVFEDTYSLHLREEHRKALHNALRDKNIPLALASLKALEQVGDETAIAHVNAYLNKTRSPLAKERCRECLTYLEQNTERHRNAQTLLRASSANSVGEEELLRPSYGGDTAPPEELLRPTSGDTHSLHE